jgi:transcriptional regulator with XRE-family HTH domain
VQGILYTFLEINAEVQMERIRQLRKERGLSQARLAVMADMDPATLNRLERGTGNPNLKTLERVADALEVEVADFFPKAPRRSSLEPSLLNGLEDEGRSEASPTTGEITAIKRWLSYLEQRLSEGNLTCEEIAHDIDAARAFGIGKYPALYSTDLVGDFLRIGRRALEEGKSFDTLQTELAGLEADMDQLEEAYAEAKEQQS